MVFEKYDLVSFYQEDDPSLVVDRKSPSFILKPVSAGGLIT